MISQKVLNCLLLHLLFDSGGILSWYPIRNLRNYSINYNKNTLEKRKQGWRRKEFDCISKLDFKKVHIVYEGKNVSDSNRYFVRVRDLVDTRNIVSNFSKIRICVSDRVMRPMPI